MLNWAGRGAEPALRQHRNLQGLSQGVTGGTVAPGIVQGLELG